MKKLFTYLLMLAFILGFIPNYASAAPKTLYEYYNGDLPSISERAITAAQLGIFQYKGTFNQNVKLLERLKPIIDEDMVGFSVVTNYRTTLSASMTSSQTTIPVSSITTKDDHVLTFDDLGSVIFLVIEPGGSKEEIVKCTAVSSTTWTTCTRGLAFYGTSESAVSANQKTHNAGSVVVMSNTHYVYEQIVDKDTAETIAGVKTFTSFPVGPSEAPTTDYQMANKKYIDDVAVSGAPDASPTTKGLVEEATSAETIAGTDSGGTTAPLFALPSDIATNTQNATFSYGLATDNFVAAFLTGGTSAQSTAATWAAISDASFRITIDGTAHNIDAIDFTGDTDMDDVAATLQVAVRTATSALETVVWDTDHFIFTSQNIASADSAMTVAETSTGTVGTDISGAGGDNWLDSDTGNGTVTNTTALTEYILALTPVITAYAAGQTFYIKTGNINLGAMNIDIDGLGAKDIFKNGDEELVNADIKKGALITLIYDGTQFQLQTQQSNMPTTALLEESATFFGATDISGAEAEILTDTSNADSLHIHSELDGDAKLLGVGKADEVKTYWNFEAPFVVYNQSNTASLHLMWTTVQIDSTWFQSVGTFTWAQKAAGNLSNSVLTTDAIFSSPTFGSVSDGLQFNDGKKVIAEFGVKLTGNANEQQGFGLSEDNAPFFDYDSQASDACNFSLDAAGGLYAHTSDKAVGHTEEAITGVTITNMTTYRIEFDPGVDAKFYVDGVLKATITTNLPDGANDIKFGWGADGNAGNEDNRIVTAPYFSIEK